jgi:outer membrane protein TolC
VDSLVDIPNSLSHVEYIEKSLDNRPEIKIMEKQIDIAKSQLKVVKSEYKPQFVSFANYIYQNPNHMGIDDGEFTWNAGLSLSMPIFHWGERQLKIHEQKMENRKVELQYESTKEFLILEIHQAIFKLKESLTKIEITKESLTQAEENLKLERNRLDEGLIATTDLLNAQMQWQKSYADYIDAKVNFKISESNYYKTIGELKY